MARRPTGRSSRGPNAERKPREERLTELRHTAAQTFYERGYDATSLQEIADRLGLLKGSLYYYIESKEDLLFDVVSSVHREGLAVVQECVNGSGGPLDRLERVIVAHVAHACRNLVPTAVFLREFSALSEDRQQEIMGTDHSYQGVFRDLLAQAQEQELLRPGIDPKIAALSILGSTNWIYRWFRPDGPYTPEEIGQQLADMALYSIGTRRALAAWERRRARHGD